MIDLHKLLLRIERWQQSQTWLDKNHEWSNDIRLLNHDHTVHRFVANECRHFRYLKNEFSFQWTDALKTRNASMLRSIDASRVTWTQFNVRQTKANRSFWRFHFYLNTFYIEYQWKSSHNMKNTRLSSTMIAAHFLPTIVQK